MANQVKRFFANLSIARKMLLGYLALAFLTVILGVFAIYSLNHLNTLNSTIISINTPLLRTSESLADAILSQEVYASRHAIFKKPQTLELLNSKCSEAKEYAAELDQLSKKAGMGANDLLPLFNEYTEMLENGLVKLATPKKASSAEYIKKLHSVQEDLLTLLHKISTEARKEQDQKITQAYETSVDAFWITLFLCSLCIVVGLLAAAVITRNISRSILTLKDATEHISEGNFHNLPTVESGDEIGGLSKAFNEMAERLRSLEEMYLDASPLTHLPGGIAIENVLKKRIASAHEIAFCLLDIDNFKAYNDRYGYARGSDLIRALGELIEREMQEHGSHSDFIGHVGGDDFVIISTPDNFTDICTSIIAGFDALVPDFYDPKDRERGYIRGKTRQGEEITFPLATLSIAVVTNTNRNITSHLQIGEIASELKEYAKSLPGSIYVVDHRRKPD